jgi:lipid A 3-O-deacylase PagL
MLCLVICLTVTVAAQAPPAMRPDSWPMNGQWDFSIWGSTATGYEHIRSLGDGQISTAGFTLSRVISDEMGPGWCRGRLQYGFSLVPILAVSAPHGFFGGGFDPVVLRWNFDRRGRVAPYAEASGGAIITTRTFPYGDSSNFNFAAAVGPGLQVATGKRQALDLGIRYRHYSNAFLGTFNPSFNGVQFLVGFHWFK